MSDLMHVPTLVVNQQARLIDLTNRYQIRAADGSPLGYIQQEGQSKARKVLRFVSDIDQFLTHQLALYDEAGEKLLTMTRPAKVFKSRLIVEGGDGRPIGEIVQRNVFGKISFDLVDALGQTLGQIKAENWRAWDFSIVGADGAEVARIDKKFVGVAKAMFTNADNYVVDINPDLAGDFRLLVVAAATAVDTALKQDARGIDASDALDLFS